MAITKGVKFPQYSISQHQDPVSKSDSDFSWGDAAAGLAVGAVISFIGFLALYWNLSKTIKQSSASKGNLSYSHSSYRNLGTAATR